MTKLNKVLLSIPAIIGLAFLGRFYYFILAPSMTGSGFSPYPLLGVVQGTSLIQIIILLKKLWSFKDLQKSKKTEWTWLLILVSPVTSLIFLWKKMDEFEKVKEN